MSDTHHLDAPPTDDVPVDRSVKVPHLVFGLLFLGAAAIWALVASDVITTDRLAFLGPGVLIVAGVIGLAASLASNRNRTPPPGPPPARRTCRRHRDDHRVRRPTRPPSTTRHPGDPMTEQPQPQPSTQASPPAQQSSRTPAPAARPRLQAADPHRWDSPVSGVCGGIAHYLGVDPTLVRVLAAIAMVVTFPAGPIVYAVLWAVIPEPEPVAAVSVRPRARQRPGDHLVGRPLEAGNDRLQGQLAQPRHGLLEGGLVGLGVLLAPERLEHPGAQDRRSARRPARPCGG